MAAEGNARLPRPRRRFGQHFLTDPRALDRIVDALGPSPSETIVEIGPGRGALTDRLASRCSRLVAIELDRDLAAHLRRRYAGNSSVVVVEGDALETDWAAVAGGPFLLAGNLPYYITTPLLFRILASPRATRAVVLVQREVASRLTAVPGTREYGALTVNVQVAARVTLVGRVGAGSFHPRPAVDSAIVRVTPLDAPLVGTAEELPFRRFVQSIFGMRRKQMLRIVRESGVPDAATAEHRLTALGIAVSARPETLAPTDFVALFRSLTA